MANCIECGEKSNYNTWQGYNGITRALCENCTLGMYAETDLENTQYGKDEIICPYCYHHQDDIAEWYNADNDEYECQSCSKEFLVSAEQVTEFNTSCMVTDQDIEEEVERRKKK